MMAQTAAGLGRLAAILTVALGCAAARPAVAGSLEFNPIIIDLPAGQHASTLEVMNRGDQPTVVQVEVFAWSQLGDEDRLQPTTDIVVSPPAATIAAGEAQTVRLILHRGDAPKEAFYRVQISELPAPGRPAGVAFLINASLPVFVLPAQRGNPVLAWRAERESNGQTVLVASNTGNREVRISELTVSLPNGAKVKAQSLGQMPYVLPGVERRWRLDGATQPPLGATLSLSATTMSMKPETATVTVASAPPGAPIARTAATAKAP